VYFLIEYVIFFLGPWRWGRLASATARFAARTARTSQSSRTSEPQWSSIAGIVLLHIRL